jgi:hypothetical protein
MHRQLDKEATQYNVQTNQYDQETTCWVLEMQLVVEAQSRHRHRGSRNIATCPTMVKLHRV